MEGNDEFASEMPSMPDLESFNMTSFDMNMDLEDFPDMPSFNNDFSMNGMANLDDEYLGDLNDFTVEENQLEQQEFEESSGQEAERACAEDDEDGAVGEQEIMSDGSMTPVEHNDSPLHDSDDNNGHHTDCENGDQSSLSSPERENTELMEQNEKLLARLTQKKKEGFDKLPKRKETDDSSQSQENELISQKPRKSSIRKTENKEKKSVEFELPKENAPPKKTRYGPDGREQTEMEAQAHDYLEQRKRSSALNFNIFLHRERKQGKLSS